MLRTTTLEDPPEDRSQPLAKLHGLDDYVVQLC